MSEGEWVDLSMLADFSETYSPLSPRQHAGCEISALFSVLFQLEGGDLCCLPLTGLYITERVITWRLFPFSFSSFFICH